jgi:hypothetical protein
MKRRDNFILDPQPILEKQNWRKSEKNPAREWMKADALPREILQFLTPTENESPYTTLGNYRYRLEGNGYVGRYKTSQM